MKANKRLVFIFGLLLLSTSLIAVEQTSDDQTDNTYIYTDKDIKELRIHNIVDLLNRIPGVKAGESHVSIRGSYKVKVFLDGRPINDPTSSHGGVKLDLVNLKNVARIELRKGQGSTEFGDDAGGGVILIQSKNIDEASGNIKSFVGSANTANISGDYQTQLGSLGIGISMAGDTTDGFRTNNDKKKERVGLRVNYNMSEDLKIQTSFDTFV